MQEIVNKLHGVNYFWKSTLRAERGEGKEGGQPVIPKAPRDALRNVRGAGSEGLQAPD